MDLIALAGDRAPAAKQTLEKVQMVHADCLPPAPAF